MKNYIQFYEIGIFYNVFDEDAIILNYLFDYKIKKNRLGFPVNKIDDIVLKLKELKINYKITTLINYSKNNYFDILNQANENIEINDKIKFINYYLKENPNKIEKIYNLCMKN